MEGGTPVIGSSRYLRSERGIEEGRRRSAETRVDGEWMKRFTTDIVALAVRVGSDDDGKKEEMVCGEGLHVCWSELKKAERRTLYATGPHGNINNEAWPNSDSNLSPSSSFWSNLHHHRHPPPIPSCRPNQTIK